MAVSRAFPSCQFMAEILKHHMIVVRTVFSQPYDPLFLTLSPLLSWLYPLSQMIWLTYFTDVQMLSFVDIACFGCGMWVLPQQCPYPNMRFAIPPWSISCMHFVYIWTLPFSIDSIIFTTTINSSLYISMWWTFFPVILAQTRLQMGVLHVYRNILNSVLLHHWIVCWNLMAIPLNRTFPAGSPFLIYYEKVLG